MKKHHFKFWHSVAGMLVLVILELFAMRLFSQAGLLIGIILAVSIIGSIVAIYVATEIIEEVRGAFRMILLLCAIVLQFVIFFTFQYLFLAIVQPGSFPTLLLDPSSLILHSVMIFVFNPLFLPATAAGRYLVLVQTFAALGLALFVLQNIGEIRRKSLDTNTKKPSN